MDYKQASLDLHRKVHGKYSIVSDVPLATKDDLSLAYTPGVAAVSEAIVANKQDKYVLTSIGKTIAIISNGTAVLGLGNIGPDAAYAVMEGKAVLFKEFGGVNALPLCVPYTDPATFVDRIEELSLNFAGINLEDIKAPECFVIEEELKKRLSIPVFHDDQHGTAVVVFAALTNALKLAGKQMSDIRVVIIGAGAAGGAIGLLLMDKVKELLMLDSKGILTADRTFGDLEDRKRLLASVNPGISGGLDEAITGADVFIGVSKPGLLTKAHIDKMADKPIVFALANPIPEIMPEEAAEAGVFLLATGRSDSPNQINNVLAFPGIFAGTLAAKASDITESMKVAAAKAIASSIEPTMEQFIPSPLDRNVHAKVKEAVEKAARG